MKFILTLPILCVLNTNVKAQLQLNEIMKGNGFVGVWPESPEWSIDGRHIYYYKKHTDSLVPTYYSYQLQNGQTQLLQPDDWEQRWVYHPELGRLNQFRFHQNELQYLQDPNKPIQSYALFANDIWNLQIQSSISSVAFQQGLSLFLFDFNSGKAQQLISYRKKPDGQIQKGELGSAESMLFESVRIKQLQVSKTNKKSVFNLPFEPDGALQIDPSARYVILKKQQAQPLKPTEVPHYIAADGHVFNEKSRAKVQDTEPSEELFVHDLAADSLVKLDFSILSNLKKTDRELIFHPVIFASTQALAIVDIRSADNKDRWIVCIDLLTMKIEELEHQIDSAWIGGPGISSWNFEKGTLGWLKDAQVIYFQSEESGFSHLYLLDVSTKSKVALTSGNFEVYDARLSKDSSTFFLTTNMIHPGTRSFHVLDILTKQINSVLAGLGAYEVELSADEKQLAYRFSTSIRPWEIYTCPLKKTSNAIQITDSRTDVYRSYSWQQPEILSFSASDGQSVYARLYTPKQEDKNGAAVLFVHGAGYLQNAHHYWSHYYREFMFHQLLIEQGYTVLDVDYRASEGYGRDCRTAIYRHMGGRDLQDYVDAKHFLVSNYAIDSNRVGIYGGSYGGFLTLMGLFTQPGTFACGAALRSVTDWAHYNHEYTTNILNTPKEDPEAYQRSSPIFFAEGLKDPLLILHGMIDDNVQFQDVVRLNQRLIELGKKDWWMALYPVERHGFKYATSWTDEYRRILELFDTYLK